MDPLHHMSTNNNSWKNNRKIYFTCSFNLNKAAQITFEIYSQVVKEHSLNQFRAWKISDPLHLLHREYQQK
jgi:hypothetical protein